MVIISFDAVGDDVFDEMLGYPAFAALAAGSAVFRGVSSVFPSNTYPVHTSVATGTVPGIHGIVSNTEPFPSPNPVWHTRESGIRVKTIWQAASESGIRTAAVLWPVTAHSKTIRYNIPEVLPAPGQSQIAASLSVGSKFLQIQMLLRHGKLLNGIKQPELDSFTAACAADILRSRRPGLTLVHLTAYDSLCHMHGKGGRALDAAKASLDRSLAVILDAAGSEEIILFSDHSQINVHTVIDPNEALAEAGITVSEDGCFVESCGGSAFFYARGISARRIEELKSGFGGSAGFRRFLTHDEMEISGHTGAAFGFCAEAGYCYGPRGSGERANHGYPLDMPGYTVFYMVRGKGYRPGDMFSGGSLLDIAPAAARMLGIKYPF